MTKDLNIKSFACNNIFLDRGISNEYSDEDEEFSSGEENEDGLSGYAAKRDYASKRGNYRKLDRDDGEVDETNLGPIQVDSDSEFENNLKEKGSRANKISRVRN